MTNSKMSKAAAPPAQRPQRTFLKKTIAFVLALIVIYFAARQVVHSWDEVTAYPWELSVGWLILSLIGHLITLALFSQIWCFLISGFGHQVPLKYAFKISYIASLGRYIPGKIWPVFGMAYLARQINIKEEVAVASWGIATMFALPSAFLAGLGGVLLYPELISEEFNIYIGGGVYIAAAVIAIVSILLVVAPNRALALFNVVLRALKRPVLTFRLTIGLAIKVYLGYIICWIAFGASFWMFLRAIIPDPHVPIVSAATAFVVAYQIGYLAFFSPGGLGVRELTITGMLGQYVGPIAAGIAVAARLWNLVAEFLAVLIALGIKLRKQ
ncbi:MAG: lysylphosphatidylglycerol synthase transmembrane domain-containing protein [Candidatus Zixiibacteriota bacterium]